MTRGHQHRRWRAWPQLLLLLLGVCVGQLLMRADGSGRLTFLEGKVVGFHGLERPRRTGER